MIWFALFSSEHFRQRMYIFTEPKCRPCSVCFNSNTSKLDGHLSTLADKFILFYYGKYRQLQWSEEVGAFLWLYRLCNILQTELKLHELSRTLVSVSTEILVLFLEFTIVSTISNSVSLCKFVFDCFYFNSP